MSNNINKKVLLIGVGNMGTEYAKALKALGADVTAVGNGEEKSKAFEDATGVKALRGGVSAYFENEYDENNKPSCAIIAVPIEILDATAIMVMKKGIRKILLEKPGALTFEQIYEVQRVANETDSTVYIAYNRRYYASVINAKKMIEEDGGVRSFNFEFTEWKSAIDVQSEGVKQNMFYANSTHVVDIAFFLGGTPKEMACFCAGDKSWHKYGTAFSGAGIADNGATFSYQANWNAPGRWRVEILTDKRRFIFAPMEKLQVQKINSVAVAFEDIDDSLDQEYKPGMYLQVEAFLNDASDTNLCTLEEHCSHTRLYEKMMCKEG